MHERLPTPSVDVSPQSRRSLARHHRDGIATEFGSDVATAEVPSLPSAAARNSHLAAGDFIRVFGTVAVVCQHVAHRTTLFGTADLNSATWWSIMSIEAACRWAVPLFVMLSGALLLDPGRQETPREFYRKRFWRIGVPLAFWSMFYTLPRAAANGFSAETLDEIGVALVHGRPAYHMYFLFIIAGLYLLTPYLRAMIDRWSDASLRTTWMTLILLAWIDGVAGFVFRYQHTVLTEFLPYVGYYLAGYELRRVRLSSKGTWIASGVIALSLSSMVIVTVLWVDQFGISGRTRYLYGYFSPTVIAVSVCLFLLMITAFERPQNGTFGRWVAWLAPTTLGIYLIHPALGIALEQAQKRGLAPVWDGTVLSLVLTTLAALVISWMATVICQRVPVVRSVVG
jgi:surface polysaccharide O-acyltransferase-like enzyme